jgi:ribonuclease P protein component
MQLLFLPAASFPGRVGFIVGRKAMPRAVDRNRLKRKLRELVRAARPGVHAVDVVFRVKQALPRQSIDAAADEARALLVAVLARP